MPMGIVSDEDLEKEKTSGKIKEIEKPGRRPGDVNVPEPIRKAIAEVAIESGRKEALAIAEMFDVSASSVSAYQSGRTSTADNKESNQDLVKVNRDKRESIIGKAQNKLTLAINEITENKLKDLDAVQCSQVAKNMAGIVKDFAPELKDSPDIQQQLVIYAPFLREEKEFPVIQAYGE